MACIAWITLKFSVVHKAVALQLGLNLCASVSTTYAARFGARPLSPEDDGETQDQDGAELVRPWLRLEACPSMLARSRHPELRASIHTFPTQGLLDALELADEQTMSHLLPKVMVPYITRPGEIPRRVQIQRCATQPAPQLTGLTCAHHPLAGCLPSSQLNERHPGPCCSRWRACSNMCGCVRAGRCGCTRSTISRGPSRRRVCRRHHNSRTARQPLCCRCKCLTTQTTKAAHTRNGCPNEQVSRW